MRKFVMVSPTFWVGQTGRELRKAGTEAQLLALYMLSNPLANYTGLYRLPIIYIANDTGISIEKVRETLIAVEKTGFARYDEASEYVWIVEGARHQLGEELKEKDLKVKYVNKEFAAISKDCPFLAAYFAKYSTTLRLVARKDVVCEAPAAAKAPAPAPAPTPVPASAKEKSLELPFGETADGVILAPEEIASKLSAFLTKRIESGASPAGERAVAAYLLNLFNDKDGYIVERVMNSAAAAGDYDIIDYVLYEQEAIDYRDI